MRALAEMSRHDFIWPEVFPGGIKGLIKSALKKAQEQLEVAEERAENKAATAKQSAPFLMHWLGCLRIYGCGLLQIQWQLM